MATFQYLKEAARKKRTDILEGFVVMGKGEMVSNLLRVDLDWI